MKINTFSFNLLWCGSSLLFQVMLCFLEKPLHIMLYFWANREVSSQNNKKLVLLCIMISVSSL